MGKITVEMHLYAETLNCVRFRQPTPRHGLTYVGDFYLHKATLREARPHKITLTIEGEGVSDPIGGDFAEPPG